MGERNVFLDTIYAMGSFFILPTVWLLMNRKKLSVRQNSVSHVVWVYIFLLYLYLVIKDVTETGTIWDFIEIGRIQPVISLDLFSNSLEIQKRLNVFMFMPLGFLLPLIWQNFRKMGKVVLTGFCMSFMIEVLQCFDGRVSDVEDLLMNTLGAFFGYVLWFFFKAICWRRTEKTAEIHSWEPIILIGLGTLGIFLLYNRYWIG